MGELCNRFTFNRNWERFS